MDRVIRAHEVYQDGHREFFDNHLFSIFSASDYGGKQIHAKILEFDLASPWESNWKLLEIMTELNSPED